MIKKSKNIMNNNNLDYELSEEKVIDSEELINN